MGVGANHRVVPGRDAVVIGESWICRFANTPARALELETGWQNGARDRLGRIENTRDKGLHSRFAKIGNRLYDGGKIRKVDSMPLQTIETNEGDIARKLQTGIADRPDCSGRHGVAAAEHGMRTPTPGIEQIGHAQVAASLCEITNCDEIQINIATGLFQCEAIAGKAILGGAGIGRSGDVGDPLVPVPDQMGNGIPRGEQVVDVDRGDLIMPTDDDGRKIVIGDALDEAIAFDSSGEDYPVEVAPPDDPLIESLGRLLIVDWLHHEHQSVIGIIAGVGDTLDETGEIRICKDEGDRAGDLKSEDAGAAGGKGSSGRIGLEVMPLDDRENPLTGIVADTAIFVDNARDGGARHSSQSGHFFQVQTRLSSVRALPRR